MQTSTITAPRVGFQPPASEHELRFDPLYVGGRGLSFPCDAEGRVDLDRLSERARYNYFYARTLMGREFAYPAVRETGEHEHEAHERLPAAAAPLARLASSALSATRSLLAATARG